MVLILCAGCASTGKAIIRATGKEIRASELLPQKDITAPEEEAFPLAFDQLSYKALAAGEVGTYEVASGVIRDIILDADPVPVFEKLIQQEFKRKGIQNRPSTLALKGSVTSLSVNGDRAYPQTFSGQVSVVLAVYDVKTGAQLWSRSYSGWGSGTEPQSAFVTAFQNMTAAITADNSILELKDTYLVSIGKKPSDGLIAGKGKRPGEITPVPSKLKAAKDEKKPGGKGGRMLPEITITSPEVKRGINIVSRSSSVPIIGRATAESGIAWVTVNGEEATLDENGNFTADILLKLGENRIVVTAMDVRKNQNTEKFTIVRKADKTVSPASEEAAATPPDGMRYFALIIGINNYRNLDRLRTAVNDARSVAQVLKTDYGFETTLILNEQATRDNIMKELNTLRRKLTSRDRLLIYYAGHGDYNRDTDTAYWLPVNADRDDNTNWIESKSISDQLKLISARHILVVADSCYSGTLTRKAATDLSGHDTREMYLRKLQEKPSRILIASGGNEPVSDSGGKAHSVFAEVFIQALKNTERDVFTAEEMHTLYIREHVAGRTEQTPEYRVIRNSGHDGGDFVFVKRR